jgi:hypothetical protein
MTRQDSLWRETNQDCDHCGGIIMQRLASGGTLTADRGYYRCAQCGCEWSKEWRLLHVGQTAACQALGDQLQAEEVLSELKELPSWLSGRGWLYLGGALLLFIILARFGATAALIRLALPLLFVALIVGLIWYAFLRRR